MGPLSSYTMTDFTLGASNLFSLTRLGSCDKRKDLKLLEINIRDEKYGSSRREKGQRSMARKIEIVSKPLNKPRRERTYS